MRKLKLEELNRVDVETYKQSAKLPITVVLDNIRSAFNVGSIFRTCDGLGISDIVLTGITARPPHKEINKAAIGATESVAWTYEKDIVEYIFQIDKSAATIYGVEQTDSSVMLTDMELPSLDKKIFLIFGNEVEGLNDAVLPHLTQAIEIQQYGTKHSFNVAVCAGMVLWHFSGLIRNGS